MSIADAMKGFQQAATNVPYADVLHESLVQLMVTKLTEHYRLPGSAQKIGEVFAKLRELSAESDGLIYLFCLHTALEASKISCRHLPYFGAIDQACLELAGDYATMCDQLANQGKLGPPSPGDPG